MCYAVWNGGSEHKPGEPAVRYEALNVFGLHTGLIIQSQAGELLPRAPRGFTWRLVRSEDIESA